MPRNISPALLVLTILAACSTRTQSEEALEASRQSAGAERLQAAGQFRARFDDITLVRPDGKEVFLNPVTTEYDQQGYLTDLRATGAPSGLGQARPGESAEDFVLRFISDNSALWSNAVLDVHGDVNDGIVVAQVEDVASPAGVPTQYVHLEQYRGGLRVIDADVLAVVSDRRLVKVSGPIVPAGLVFEAASEVPEDELILIAEEEVARGGYMPYQSTVARAGYSLQYGEAVTDIEVILVGPRDEVVRQTQTVRLSTSTGNILEVTGNEGAWPTQSASYHVFRPNSTDASPNTVREYNMTGRATTLSSAFILPWLDEESSRSPVPTYDFTQDWGSSGLGFPYNTDGSSNFHWAKGTNFFRYQQMSYWGQRAVRAGDINFEWWPPSNSSYKYAPVVLVANAPNTGALGLAGNNGCWNWDTWDGRGDVGQSPKATCIRIRADAYYAGSESAPRLATIFHEVGHAIDYKYGAGAGRSSSFGSVCDPNTNDESLSLSETIPALYSIMMMNHEFSSSYAFLDEDGDGSANGLKGVSGSPAPTHRGDNSLICHAPTGADCAPPNLYTYGEALQQAYWEATEGLNCDGPEADACYVLPGSANRDYARWALFYAMKTSSRNSSFRAFVADFLDYYYYNAPGYSDWNDRWWIFNHHDLVGPSYSYTPCSSD